MRDSEFSEKDMYIAFKQGIQAVLWDSLLEDWNNPPTENQMTKSFEQRILGVSDLTCLDS